jgi:hypothetical protein
MLKKNKAILEGLRVDLDVARGEISSTETVGKQYADYFQRLSTLDGKGWYACGD